MYQDSCSGETEGYDPININVKATVDLLARSIGPPVIYAASFVSHRITDSPFRVLDLMLAIAELFDGLLDLTVTGIACVIRHVWNSRRVCVCDVYMKALTGLKQIRWIDSFAKIELGGLEKVVVNDDMISRPRSWRTIQFLYHSTEEVRYLPFGHCNSITMVKYLQLASLGSPRFLENRAVA